MYYAHSWDETCLRGWSLPTLRYEQEFYSCNNSWATSILSILSRYTLKEVVSQVYRVYVHYTMHGVYCTAMYITDI